MAENKKHNLPRYLRDKYQLIATVTFVALFSVIFMLVSIPFSDNAWFELRPSRAFAFTAVFFTICLLILIISRRVMYALRRMRMTYAQYVLWIVGEAILICLLYTACTLQGDEIGIIDIDDASFLELMGKAFVYAFTSIIVPNIIAAMYFAIVDKNKAINRPAPQSTVAEDKKIALYVNTGVLKFSISVSALYYIEADDNYIIAWYQGAGNELDKYMLRSSLKAVEALRAAGFEVVGMVAAYTYGFPIAEQAFQKAGVRLLTLTNYEAVVSVAIESGYITADQQPTLNEWRKDPANWMAGSIK